MKLKETLITCLSAAALTATLFNPALAASETVDVKSGRTTVIYRFGFYASDTCYPLPVPKVAFTQPNHGTFSTTIRPGKVTKGHCKGKSLKQLYVLYKPKPGFRGADKGQARFTYSMYVGSTRQSSKWINFTLNVK